MIYGNVTDKYHTKNPLYRRLMANFLHTMQEMLQGISVRTVCEVGCGEGELLCHLHQIFPETKLYGMDISFEILQEARRNCVNAPIRFFVGSAENLNLSDNEFDLVVCSEVLEHVFTPEKALQELYRISKRFVFVSVPYEPLWRVLNMMRGKYIRQWGNTPGHVNHWSPKALDKFLSTAPFCVVEKRYPIPWQMVLLEKK